MSPRSGLASDAYVLGMRVSPTSYAEATEVIGEWAQNGHSKYVCVATVNNVMESYDSDIIRAAMNGADLVTPDGMPLVWALKLLGYKDATRVYGPDLMPKLLRQAAEAGTPVGLYGATPPVLNRLREAIVARFAGINIAFTFSPPFSSLTPEEDAHIVEDINNSGTKLLFVGLSSPKQDRWMAQHRDKIHGVMVGVGAAFDFLAGTKRQAPRWMMDAGLEWLFRLLTEPRRLWKRYLKHNPRFIAYFALQLLGVKRYQGKLAVET